MVIKCWFYFFRLQQLEDGGSGLADPVNTSAIRLHDVKLPANKTDSSQTPESHQSIKHRANHFSLEEVEELEGYITELQAANDAEVLARMNLERSFHETQDSVVVELEARVELEQQVYDLQESNQLLKDKVSQLLVSLPVVSDMSWRVHTHTHTHTYHAHTHMHTHIHIGH